MHFYVDEVCADYVRGWVVDAKGVKSVEISIDGHMVGAAHTGLPRPDIGAAYPEIEGSSAAGFLYLFRSEQFHRPVSSVTVQLVSNDGNSSTATFDRIPTIFSTGTEQDAAPNSSPDMSLGFQIPSPFPAEITRVLAALNPTYDTSISWDAEAEQQAVNDILWLLKSGSRSLYPVNSYVLFLKRLRTTFESILKLFPRFNTMASSDLKDVNAIATSPDEMLCISHHLRVLTSYGLRGSLTEFGCFKGFSSSCLSHTCHELGIELHVFDSFEGLPSSESSYYQAGEFAGTFEEVFRNIKAFGKIDNVQFFRGFFSVTVPGYDKQPLALWMDVDLASSAEDAMRMLSRMPAQGVVFSHEWPEGFIQGEIDVKHRHSDAVLPPVVSAFEARGGHPVGQFLCGRLGVIWDRKRGVRPLGIDSISALCNAI